MRRILDYWIGDCWVLVGSWKGLFGVVRTRLESIVIFLIILIAKHDGVGMNCQYNQQEESMEQIQEELTVQDINLRQQMQTNRSRGSIPPLDHSAHKRPPLHCNTTKHPPNHSTPSSHQPFIQSLSYWSQSCASTFTPHKNSGKIRSVAYDHRNRSSGNNRSQGRRARINVSLSLKNKSGTSPKKQSNSIHERYSAGCRQPIQVNQFLTDFTGVVVNKQNEEHRAQRSTVKIQQPKFHKNHPLHNQWKYNGGCLSKIIVQRAVQPKNITSL